MRSYLDHNASAPLRPEARAALLAALDDCGNASSSHREGQQARQWIESARGEVARLAGAHPREVLFVASGTEALNLAIRGPLPALAPERSDLVVSAIEHDAVLATAEALAAEGFRVRRAPVDSSGRLCLDALAGLLGERTALLAVMMANNETGVLQPVAEAAALAHAAGALVVVDAVQAAGRVELDRARLGADYLSISAHKLGGAPGAAALVVRRGAPLAAQIHGGGQERGLRSGSENVPAIAAFGAAARAAASTLAVEGEGVRILRDHLEREIERRLPGVRINGVAAERLANTCSLTVPGCDAESLVVRLDLEGIAASTGSACASGAAAPSHVLAAMGLSPEACRATLRLSLGWCTTRADIEHALAALERALAAQISAGVMRA